MTPRPDRKLPEALRFDTLATARGESLYAVVGLPGVYAVADGQCPGTFMVDFGDEVLTLRRDCDAELELATAGFVAALIDVTQVAPEVRALALQRLFESETSHP